MYMVCVHPVKIAFRPLGQKAMVTQVIHIEELGSPNPTGKSKRFE